MGLPKRPEGEPTVVTPSIGGGGDTVSRHPLAEVDGGQVPPWT